MPRLTGRTVRPRQLFPVLVLAASVLLPSAATLATAGASTGAAQIAASSTRASASISQPLQKDQLLYILNAERARAGRAPLALREGIADVAREWAARMASEWALRHRPDLGPALDRAGVSWRTAGENVGYGPHVSDVHAKFMRSTSHRAILLSGDFSEVGIGVTARDGRVWVTVDFVGH